MAIPSALGVLTGFGLLIRKLDNETGIVVAVSTVVAFVLLLGSC